MSNLEVHFKSQQFELFNKFPKSLIALNVPWHCEHENFSSGRAAALIREITMQSLTREPQQFQKLSTKIRRASNFSPPLVRRTLCDMPLGESA